MRGPAGLSSDVRRSRHLVLAPPATKHLDDLHHLLNLPEVAASWRLGGRGLAIADTPRVLAERVALSLVAHDATTGRLAGLVELVDLDEAARSAQVCVALDPDRHGSGLLLEALAVLLDEGFARLPLRKAYAMMNAEVHRSVAAGLAPLVRSGVVTHEGTLLEHRSLGGRWHDVVVLGIWPDPLRAALRSGSPLRRLSPEGWRLAA